MHFTQNKGAYDADQVNIREQCLSYWELPNIERSNTIERFNRPFTMSLNKLTSGVIFLFFFLFEYLYIIFTFNV